MTTLRVWERRYGVVAAARTASGRRVYSLHDVSRLRLLRQLTLAGHGIGTIANLELEPLLALVRGVPALPDAGAGSVLEAVVVGRGVTHALGAVPGCVLRAVHDGLDQAEAATPTAGSIGLLLIRVDSLRPADGDRVLALGIALRADAICVVYGFGTEATAAALREAGVHLRREPLAGRELARWVSGVRSASSFAAVWPGGVAEAGSTVEPRRFSDEALADLVEQPSRVACECVRHMAEIVARLAGFERYSEDCISTGPADAALHRQFSRTAGTARTLFEEALQRVVDGERLA